MKQGILKLAVFVNCISGSIKTFHNFIVMLSLLLLVVGCDSNTKPITVSFPVDVPQIYFAMNEVKTALHNKGIKTEVGAQESADFVFLIKASNDALKAEGFAIKKEGTQIIVEGADATGAMYGGLELAEQIRLYGLNGVQETTQNPFIKKRGIKFNIPLDARSPSHDDRGTAAQTNILNMWDISFWHEYLDELARNRFNVLSLWNKHPFPSMIKLADYPDVALNDVFNAAGKVKEMTIDEKIALWKEVMVYAHKRGIEVVIITWNIHMNGVEEKYGITEDKDNPVTVDYLRKSVKQLFLTYPYLSGIGVTAGENMNGLSREGKEQWMWETYGLGVKDVKEIQPERNIRFIHRYWMTAFDNISKRFGQLEDGYDMSFKYIRAHIYSSYNPPFAESEILTRIPDGIKTWWNLRNDDHYILRWGDTEYVRQFILHLPDSSRTAGYYMGADRYMWGRESFSKNPSTPRQLDNKKHWYSFLLWGRLGYKPDIPTSHFKALVKNKFSEIQDNALFDAWESASQIVPLVNKFHWYRGDFLFWVEGCISSGILHSVDGFHTVRTFIDGKTMKNSGLITIPEYVENLLEGTNHVGQTPVDVAKQLGSFAEEALAKVSGLDAKNNMELSETIGDIKAMSYLGMYYAAKIKGATELALFDTTKEIQHKTLAIFHLEEAAKQWDNYANQLSRQYHKMEIAAQGFFDWDALKTDVQQDIQMAKTNLKQ